MYQGYIKRTLDVILSLAAIIFFSPLLLILSIAGMIQMKGVPYFVQTRVGKDERLFQLIKFRTMSNEKDKTGHFLPDEKRLNSYGRFLRATSLDELPELFNIFIGDMSIVGPRPLVPEYLPYYTEEERCRHNVKPGLTGLAQVNGRSYLSWEEIFKYDICYVRNVTIWNDIRIIFQTAKKVLRHADIADATEMLRDENGDLYVKTSCGKKKIHKELNVERKGIIQR